MSISLSLSYLVAECLGWFYRRSGWFDCESGWDVPQNNQSERCQYNLGAAHVFQHLPMTPTAYNFLLYIVWSQDILLKLCVKLLENLEKLTPQQVSHIVPTLASGMFHNNMTTVVWAIWGTASMHSHLSVAMILSTWFSHVHTCRNRVWWYVIELLTYTGYEMDIPYCLENKCPLFQQ